MLALRVNTGIAGKPERLRPLDLGVPIGALDQPHHDPPVEPPGQRIEPVDDEGGARAIGLHDDAEPVPAGKLGIGEHALDDVERQVEPVGLLGVDVEAHAGVARAASASASSRSLITGSMVSFCATS